MSYCTQSDLVTAFGENEIIDLTNKDSASDTINQTVLQLAIADADVEIDGYLAGRYALPLTVVPGVLRGLACDIVRYRLRDERVTERQQQAYDDAISYLMQVATGKLSLGVDSSNQSAPVSGGAQLSSDGRKFNAYTLKDFL